MDKYLVMTAIANEMDRRYHSMQVSEAEYAPKIYTDIKELHDAYFELRGHTGSVSFIGGMDTEVNTVKSICQMAEDRLYSINTTINSEKHEGMQQAESEEEMEL